MATNNNEFKVVWGNWDDLGDYSFQQRYIEEIVVDGRRWVANGGDMHYQGLVARGAGRGEMREIDTEDGEVDCVYTVYSSDGGPVEGNPHAEYACEHAVRMQYGHEWLDAYDRLGHNEDLADAEVEGGPQSVGEVAGKVFRAAEVNYDAREREDAILRRVGR